MYICIYIYICIHVNMNIRNMCIYIYIYINICVYIYIYIYIWEPTEDALVGNASGAACHTPHPLHTAFSIVLEAPILKMSFGNKMSRYVVRIYSDKQQLSHKIGWPVTHMHRVQGHALLFHRS